MKIQSVLSVVLAASIGGTSLMQGQTVAWTDSLIVKIRATATMVPGAPPRAVHVLRFAGIDVHQSEFLEGGGNERLRATLSVYQIRFPDGWIMVDTGIDKDTAAQPGSGGAGLTIPQDKYQQIQRALLNARSIVVTHEHDDHIAGVIRSPAREIFAQKTLLTRAQVQTLMEHPNNPVIRLDASWSDRYCVIDYASLYPLAPGVVLIKAPGHTPGSQMIYVRLASGIEILLIGDITWAMAGVDQRRQKPEPVSKEFGEDRTAIQQQIEWLHNVMGKVSLVNSHDDDAIAALIRNGVLKEGLDLRLP